jgi:hypothetical protein
MQPWPLDRLLGRETLVERSGEHLDERASQACPAGRAADEDEAVAVQDDGRRHHAAHPPAGLERPPDQVGLAEHAVQVEVEPRQPVARA